MSLFLQEVVERETFIQLRLYNPPETMLEMVWNFLMQYFVQIVFNENRQTAKIEMLPRLKLHEIVAFFLKIVTTFFVCNSFADCHNEFGSNSVMSRLERIATI